MWGGRAVNALETVGAARALLENVTPLNGDCGRFCGGACCLPDEDGQGGMLLFPGEEAFYRELPDGFSLTRDDSVVPNSLLLTCPGTCARSMRPLSCRLFPLLPVPGGAVMDRRGWAVCPLMEHGQRGLKKEFVEAVKAAGDLLYACPEHAAFLHSLHAYNEKLTAL